MTIYADSSFLVSKYLQDVHSLEAIRRTVSRPILCLTHFNRVELAHALSRQVFRGQINSAESLRGWNEFELDCRAGVWIVVDIPDRTWETAIGLARQFGPTLGIRTLDSLHVASALELRAQKFWTFDERQGRLAEATGLDTTA